MKAILVVCAATVLVGCQSMREDGYRMRSEAASGLVGCPPKEIAVTDHTSLTWTATCKGRVFYCKAGDGVACKEALPQS